MAKSKNGVNMSQSIRDLIKENPAMKTKEIVATLAPYLPAPVEVRRLSEEPSANTWRIAWGPPQFRPPSGDTALVLAPHDELTRSEFDVLGQGSHFSIIVEPPRARGVIHERE